MQASLGCWFNSGSKAVVFIVANCVIEMENDGTSLESYFVPLFSEHICRLRQVVGCHVQNFVIEHCLLVLKIWRIQTLLGIRFRGYSSDMEDTNALGYQVRRLSYHSSAAFPSIAQLVEGRTVG